MGYKIVVPHDYGPEGDNALAWASALVKAAGGTLVLLHVILVPAPPSKGVPLIPALRLTEDPDDSLGKLREVAARYHPQAEVDVFETNDAGPGIVARARELGADLIAIGTHTKGRGGLSRALLGSVVDYVVWHAACPVVAVRGPGAEPARAS
jgi:nucleotide-binding universal stress UspA family protein